jgi:signal transduction histidine kinase
MLRKQVKNISSLLTGFRATALEVVEGASRGADGLPAYQRLHALFKEIQHEAAGLENAFEENYAYAQAAARRLLSGIFLTWTLIVVGTTAGLWHREKRHAAAEKAILAANAKLQSQTEELERHREHLVEEVTARTAELTNTNLQLRQEIVEHKKTEQSLRGSEGQLRHLSFALMAAQETERKRISRELHDELGGSLAALKIGLSQIEKSLREDQRTLRERCRASSEAIGLVIDNVSRLSRNLSPYLLEEFGLSTALKRLVSNFSNSFSDIKASFDISQIDHLLPQPDQIAVYRIIQESLTNAGKHSGAKNVSVSIRRQNGTIVIVVEDDGKGFAAQSASMHDPSEKGMGLVTMDERVRMLGGTSHLWSRQGKGTRVMFTIPTGNGCS